MPAEIFNALPAFGGACADEYNCGQGAFMRLYKNAGADAFAEYLEKLEAAGFSLRSRSNIEDSLFAEFSGGGFQLFVYYTPCESALRIIADPFTALPSDSAEDKRLCGIKLWQFEVDHSLIDCGMCYIVQCSDYSFFVIDSAHIYSVNDDLRIYDFLRRHTPNDLPVVVSGWFFSHGHSDHVSKFLDILRFNRDIIIKGLYYNFVPENHFSSGSWDSSEKQHSRRFREELARHPEIPQYKLHCGQRFSFSGIQLQVLCTHEDVYPGGLENYNDSSAVLMLEAAGGRVCFLGDAGMRESDIITRRYKKTLACDIIQAAHHGHFGVSSEFYRLANASAVLFPTTQIMFDEEYEHYEANRTACSIARHCFIASNGTVEFSFPLKDSEICLYPDETFENFAGVYRLWGYEYSDGRKNELRNGFCSRQKKQYIKY